MILIADSGSTKTDWRFIDSEKKIHQFSTIGFNPYFHTTESIVTEIKEHLLPQLLIDAHLNIFFYGSGCSNEQKCGIVTDALKTCFPNSTIEIYHDLLGAARAACGKKEGIAAILGTGSNSCYYDGTNIVENVDSLGYILGDEGSGAYIGKKLIQSYLNKELPTELSNRFYERYKITKDDVLEAVYKKPSPNKYLASFSKFAYQNLKEQYMIDLVAKCFEDFFDKHICKYSKHKEVKMSCVGSVGFYYSNILRAVALNKGVVIDNILEAPIAGLTLYHLGE